MKKYNLELGKVGKSIFLVEDQFLSEYKVDEVDFSKGLPNGVLNKKYPGVGATYCEFMADRASIIVFPFRTLAYEKAEIYKKKGKNIFFVGTDPNNKSTKASSIKEWYRKNKEKNLKFSVVANSINKLVNALKEEGCDPYLEFTLVLDEVEILQMQSGFRSSLPKCFDYFKLFKSKCFVSATPLDFSDEDLNRLPKYDVEIYTQERDELGINQPKEKQRLQIERYKGMEPHVEIANKIANFFKKNWTKNQNIKFFVGINSIRGINEMIEVFEKYNTQATISAFVSSNNRDRILKKYVENQIQDQRLPSNINLTTCINWNGVDIEEEVISIAISLNTERYYSFSIENLIQFFGRSRISQGYMPFIFAIGEQCELDSFNLAYSRTQRNDQLKNLLEFIENNIDDQNDREEIKKAMLKTESGLYYENIDGNPTVNWLLEDLENYEQKKVIDYENDAKELIDKLKERYEIVEVKSDEVFDVRPSEKSAGEKEKETLEIFLDHLDPGYASSNLAMRFLDVKKPLGVRVAAYWYLFGREFQLDEQDCKKLAVEFSELNKSFYITKLVILGLRFYTRHNPAFQLFIDKLYKKRNNRKNIRSSDVIDVIESDNSFKKNFKIILQSTNKGEIGSFLAMYFFGLDKTEGKTPRFIVADGSLKIPKIIRDYPKIDAILKKVADRPVSEGIKWNSFNPVDLIDEKFSKKP